MARKNPKELLPYGHWDISICGEFDPRDYVAFVYIIHMTNGTKYIGVKKLWASIKQPPNAFKRGPRKPLVEHKWRSYNSTSSIVKEIVEDEIEQRFIVGCFEKWGTALHSEYVWQYHLDALRKEHFLNYQMNAYLTKNTYPDDIIYDRIAKYKKEYNEETKNVIP